MRAKTPSSNHPPDPVTAAGVGFGPHRRPPDAVEADPLPLPAPPCVALADDRLPRPAPPCGGADGRTVGHIPIVPWLFETAARFCTRVLQQEPGCRRQSLPRPK